MQSRAWVYEQRAVGVAASLLFVAKLTPCITDVNHPPGTRWVRVIIAALVIGIAALEFLRPWRGILAAVIAWPHMLIVRETFFLKVSPLYAALPPLWGGTL